MSVHCIPSRTFFFFAACFAFSVVVGEDRPHPDVSAPVRVDPAVSRCLTDDGSAVAVVTLKDRSHRENPWSTRCKSFRLDQQTLLDSLPPGSCDVRYRFNYSPVVVLNITNHTAIKTLEQNPAVESVTLDIRGKGALEESRELIGVNTAYDLGLTGAGVVVAILDSGIDSSSQEFRDRIIHEHHFLDQGEDVGPGAEDAHGHGTHVTGILAAEGVEAPRGILPEAKIVAIRVLDEHNSGWIVDWTAGVDYAVNLHNEDNGIEIDVINISIASLRGWESFCDEDQKAFGNACQAAVDSGIAVFASSGNEGSTVRLRLPGCLSSTISVGSVSDMPEDVFSQFTDRNDLLDVLAPGEFIVSTIGGTEVAELRGTSQACPHAAGVGGLLKQLSPTLSPERMREILKMTGVQIPDPGVADRTFPRVDAMNALSELLSTVDCDENGTIDLLDIAAGESDCDGNGIPDSCEPDGEGMHEDCRPVFHRGDANDDGSTSLADATRLLGFLFHGDADVGCLETADANQDHQINISDVIFLLNFLFRAGPSPTESDPGGWYCGPDADTAGSVGDLGCETYASCG